ncbi:MAG: DUF6691 family protein [Bdellovibrionota bacterium]
MKSLVSLVSGLIFALGLSLSGMIRPEKVRAFLAFGRPEWDVSLAFVMVSAIIVYAICYALVKQKKRTLTGTAFSEPAAKSVDRRLVIGMVIFGIGWGLIGLCPGPAFVRIAWMDAPLASFLVMMLIGFEIEKRIVP